MKNNVKRGKVNKIKVKSAFAIEAQIKPLRSKPNNIHCKMNILVNVERLSMCDRQLKSMRKKAFRSCHKLSVARHGHKHLPHPPI